MLVHPEPRNIHTAPQLVKQILVQRTQQTCTTYKNLTKLKKVV